MAVNFNATFGPLVTTIMQLMNGELAAGTAQATFASQVASARSAISGDQGTWRADFNRSVTTWLRVAEETFAKIARDSVCDRPRNSAALNRLIPAIGRFDTLQSVGGEPFTAP